MRKNTNLRGLSVEVTEELLEIIDHAKGKRRRGPVVEDLLWESPMVKALAKSLMLERAPRPGIGRPPNGPAAADADK